MHRPRPDHYNLACTPGNPRRPSPHTGRVVTRARHDALTALGAQSRLGWDEMQRIAQRYRGILDNPEFVGILNVSHPPCGGRRFASLRGDRVLHMDCAVEARYAVSA